MAKTTLRNQRSKTAPKDDGEFIYLKLRRDEYKLLRAKLREVAAECVRYRKRMAKFDKEVDKRKKEDERLLARLGVQHRFST